MLPSDECKTGAQFVISAAKTQNICGAEVDTINKSQWDNALHVVVGDALFG